MACATYNLFRKQIQFTLTSSARGFFYLHKVWEMSQIIEKLRQEWRIVKFKLHFVSTWLISLKHSKGLCSTSWALFWAIKMFPIYSPTITFSAHKNWRMMNASILHARPLVLVLFRSIQFLKNNEHLLSFYDREARKWIESGECGSSDENIRKKLAEMGLNRFYRSGDESISVSSFVNCQTRRSRV